MNKVALVVSTHNGTDKLIQISEWIANQLPWRGPFIVIASGNTESSRLTDVCSSQGIEFIFKQFLNCGLAKRNLGAELAKELGSDYVTFLNDYQLLKTNALYDFELEDHDEDIVFGNVEFEKTKDVVRPRISSVQVPLNKDSSNREIWSLFSSVSESGMLIKSETFSNLRGWQYPIFRGKAFLGGDGMLLAARVFTSQGSFGYSKSYAVLGGHKNVEISQEMARSRGAVYPYAFTLSTKLKHLPRWISVRFIFGRIARLLQSGLRMNFQEFKASVPEIEARIRGYFGLKPSKNSILLDEVFEFNCQSSQNYCAKQDATKCTYQ
jgi:hypothetical protein